MYKNVFLVLLLSILLSSNPALGAPKAKVWKKWLNNVSESTYQVDHTSWGIFLKRYVHTTPDNINRVSYGSVTETEKNNLNSYIDSLQKIKISQLNQREQKAFWINLYNSLTVKVILDHYPVKSIRDIDISKGLFADGPWGKKLVTVEGQRISLNDIEHRILRPIWKDPRVHYAVNCASIGCPNLQKIPFTAQNSAELLNKAAKEYINHRRGAWFKQEKLFVSSIYKWFARDFGGNDRAIISHLQQYAEEPLRKKLEKTTHINGTSYDWTLNVFKQAQ